jgi:hypothetical protein
MLYGCVERSGTAGCDVGGCRDEIAAGWWEGIKIGAIETSCGVGNNNGLAGATEGTATTTLEGGMLVGVTPEEVGSGASIPGMGAAVTFTCEDDGTAGANVVAIGVLKGSDTMIWEVGVMVGDSVVDVFLIGAIFSVTGMVGLR